MSHHGFIPSSADDLLRRRVKAELRKRMRGLRHTTPKGACAERSARIVLRLLAMPELASARSVALFFPIAEKHEVDLLAVDAALRARGAEVAYPAIDAESGVMTFRFVADVDALEERGYGFREPAIGAREAKGDELSVIVVPALVLDTNGHRVGYGAGYYDRTLPRFAPPAVTIAVTYDFQLIAEVAVTDGDVAAQWIVTDKRTARAGSTADEGAAQK
jgi:5-formyltetrahydrofolate cyclo-ligase